MKRNTLPLSGFPGQVHREPATFVISLWHGTLTGGDNDR
jgi:hypothetical protein